jgi:hypothetical protein
MRQVSSWAAEACSVLAEFESNRAIISKTPGCIQLIVDLLKSEHEVSERVCPVFAQIMAFW